MKKLIILLIVCALLSPMVTLAYGGGLSSGSSVSSGSFSGGSSSSFGGGFHTSMPSTGSFGSTGNFGGGFSQPIHSQGSFSTNNQANLQPPAKIYPPFTYVHSTNWNLFSGNFWLWYLLFNRNHNPDNTPKCDEKITINCIKTK